MRRCILMVCSLLYLLVGGMVKADSTPVMVDPAIDDSGRFSYLAKSSTSLSMMGSERACQVTFDGSLYTGWAELCFAYGLDYKAVMNRSKRLFDGWMPIVSMVQVKDGIAYEVEAFYMTLDGKPESRAVVFAKITAKNVSTEVKPFGFAAGLRFNTGDHRIVEMNQGWFDVNWSYEMANDYLIRGDKVVYFFDSNGKKEAVLGDKYHDMFSGKAKHILEDTPVGVKKHEGTLEVGEEISTTFKMPLEPIGIEDIGFISAIKSANYDEYKEQTIRYWNGLKNQGAQVFIPEEAVNDARMTNLMYTWQAVYPKDNGKWLQGVNKFQYKGFWLRDAAYIIHSDDVWGYHEIARKLLDVMPEYQGVNGLFYTYANQLDGFGQALYVLANHAIVTGDKEYAEKIYPMFIPALDWLKKVSAEDDFGLMPFTDVGDNEAIRGHFTGHNFWALLGIRSAWRIANWLREDEDAKVFEAEYKRLYDALMIAIEKKSGSDGALTPGLDAEGGQDWGNLIGVFPAEVMKPWDKHVGATLAKMHAEKFDEGVMTYMGTIHHYLTVKEAQSHIFRDEQLETLEHFYAIMAHMGSTWEMFEWNVEPWSSRDAFVNYPPHGWGSAMFNLMLRNMLIHERGGEGGLGQREIHIGAVLSPEWIKAGQKLVFKNAGTECGPVSFEYTFKEDGAEVLIDGDWHTEPRNVVIHVPFAAKLKSVTADCAPIRMLVDKVVLPADVKKVVFKWDVDKSIVLNYQETIDAYKQTYREKAEEFVKEGGELMQVTTPAWLDTEGREAAFNKLYGKEIVGIAVGKPVKISGIEGSHPAQLAVDGNAHSLMSSWWVGPPAPQWLEIDLEEVKSIDRVHVYPYWGGNRYYQYQVEVSVDGETWNVIADMSQNTKIETPRGREHRFDSIDARYVKITMLYNSSNPSMHLVELRVFEAK
ncbi:F5/8 type C domain protein [Poriferisphaera corsica]|uniref:F5/8 type C domain protein n=1 Tax=Poriferisphaera corsica TaxID=2528020 RepID=A0A517YPY6_9BACT|nr:discoidin domain-containing protein [Poriferisphaera corsica]QDU32278.1 F5/8 type C domain protein [Poriferisphaera corsica]